MYTGQFVLSQLMQHLPRRAFHQCVRRYSGDRRVRSFSCRNQFWCMAFAQLTFRESLRDLVTCLRAMKNKLYHVGLHGKVSRSTLADANERRDWRIWADFAAALISRARRLHEDEDIGLRLRQTAYVLDATVIELCLSLFPWAHSQRQRGGIKVHTLMDLRGNIPCYIRVTSTKTTDASVIDLLPIESGAYYIMDRGYNDYQRLYRLNQHHARFVLRAKNNLTTVRRESRPVDKNMGLRCDQIVTLRDRRTRAKYPASLRRVAYYDVERQRRFVFMTNDFVLPAFTITELYRRRWQIELFFKWVKQHLRIKHFFGNTPNAVKTQLWIAISVYALVAIVRKNLRVTRSMAEILQILSLSLFEKTPLYQALTAEGHTLDPHQNRNQLLLFDF